MHSTAHLVLSSVAFSLAALLPTSDPAYAQGAERGVDTGSGRERSEDASPERRDEIGLDTLVVTPTRSATPSFDTPTTTDVVDAHQIAERNLRTVPEALRFVPGVLVQETSYGQGSPYIRGFTGYRNLFLIDGIRLNNSVFRSGPNQYWNTVDPWSIEALEIVKGPTSVLYGSDAVGGTVNAITKSPYAGEGERAWSGMLAERISSAEHSLTERVEVSAALGAESGLLVGFTRKDYGNLRAGGDTGLQENTGYEEWDGDVKFDRFVADDVRLVVAHQEVHQTDVPRTHKTVFGVSFEGTSVGNELRRDLDQDRRLTYVQLRGEDLEGAFDAFTLSLSYQTQKEERDRVKSSGKRDLQGFTVDTLGLLANASSDTSWGRLTYGVEYYSDSVDSFLDKGANQSPADDIQGPVADDASYDLLGVFLQDELEATERLDFVFGLRFNYAAADANQVRDPVTDTQISINENWSALVGSARFVYSLEPERWNLFGGISQGFRAPNLSDLTRFDSARSNEFEVPAPGLDSEDYLQYELGVKGRRDDLAVQTSVFYTDISDQILRVPTGNTNSSGEFEVTKENVGDGFVYGIEAAAAYEFREGWTAFTDATYMEGKVDTFPTSAPVAEREYIDRLMPFTAHAGVRWEREDGRLWAESTATYAADADRLSTRDKKDTQRIPPGGTPSYFLLDVRAGYRLGDTVDLTFAVDNVFDEDYRVHGSGSNGPGTNAILGARWWF